MILLSAVELKQVLQIQVLLFYCIPELPEKGEARDF